MGKGYKKRRNNKNKPPREHKPRPDAVEGISYVSSLIDRGNFKMECYYAIQGIHNQRFVEVAESSSVGVNEEVLDNGAAMMNVDDSCIQQQQPQQSQQLLVDCTCDDERHEERNQWRHILGQILPASFRIGKHVPTYHQIKLQQELHVLLQQAATFDYNNNDNMDPAETSRTATATDDDNGDIVDDDQDKDDDKATNTSTPTTTPTATTAFPPDPRTLPFAQPDQQLRIYKLQFIDNAYQLGLDRSTIRKNPALVTLHNWLKQQVNSGHVTRQETVSMIPPLLLHVQSHDMVLDMCAAPGSKTSQLLEDLLVSTSGSSSGSAGGGGVLVANDASAARAYMLVHQLRRILHQHPVALITACPAQFMASSNVDLQYTKILCDVPCTGDGTTRKNIGIWKSWSAISALALHTLQVAIAIKGASQLLQVGGYMVYSTCSMNPIENEAVVAEILRQSHGAMELIDYSNRNDPHHPVNSTSTNETTTGSTNDDDNNSNKNDKKQQSQQSQQPLSGFRTRPGWHTWKVLCEPLTERQIKNKYNKNNAKMQAKRQRLKEEAQEQAEQQASSTTTATGDGETTTASAAPEETITTNNEVGDETTDAAASSTANNNDDIVLPATLKRSVMPKFEPASLCDEEALLKMAASEGLHYYRTYDDVPESLQQKRIKPSAFPPTPDEVSQFQLQRCIRCLPHDNNTGGFFVALLRKTAPWSSVDRRRQRQNQLQQDADGVVMEPDTKRPKGETLDDSIGMDDEEEEVVDDDDVVVGNDDDDDDGLDGLDADNKPISRRATNGGAADKVTTAQDFGKDDFAEVGKEIMDPLIEYYGLTNGFERDLYMARACSESKVIYYVARPVKRLFDLGIQKRVPIVNTGLKGFMRNNRNVTECAVSYRVCQEGVHFLVPYMTKRKFIVDIHDFRVCLSGNGKTIRLDQFSDAFRTQVTPLSPGSFVVVLEGYEDQLQEKLVLCMWKCRGDSVDGLVAKVEVDGIISQLDSLQQHQQS